MNTELRVASENAFIIYFHGDTISHSNQNVSYLVALLDQQKPPWLIDITPAYHSVLIIFDPYLIDPPAVRGKLQRLILQMRADQQSGQQGSVSLDSQLVTLPVFYDPPVDNDLQRIAEAKDLEIQDVIDIHQQQEYRVFCLGFAPGFAFLGEVDERIAMPRLATPRKKVPAGAVAIADRQSAVYPAVSPGGWNIIGLCPLSLFSAERDQPFRLKMGDRVKFKAISQQEYEQLGGKL